VAHIVPPSTKREGVVDLDDILKQLEIEGHLRRGSGRFKPFKPIRKKGKPASRIILEERD
jgi:hypothetical protein